MLLLLFESLRVCNNDMILFISMKGEWRVEMPSFQLLFLKLSPVVDVRLSCRSSAKDYPIHIPRHVAKFLDLQMVCNSQLT